MENMLEDPRKLRESKQSDTSVRWSTSSVRQSTSTARQSNSNLTPIRNEDNGHASEYLSEAVQYGADMMHEFQEIFDSEFRAMQQHIVHLVDMKRVQLLEQMSIFLSPVGPIELEVKQLRDENLQLRLQLGNVGTATSVASGQARPYWPTPQSQLAPETAAHAHYAASTEAGFTALVPGERSAASSRSGSRNHSREVPLTLPGTLEDGSSQAAHPSPDMCLVSIVGDSTAQTTEAHSPELPKGPTDSSSTDHSGTKPILHSSQEGVGVITVEGASSNLTTGVQPFPPTNPSPPTPPSSPPPALPENDAQAASSLPLPRHLSPIPGRDGAPLSPKSQGRSAGGHQSPKSPRKTPGPGGQPLARHAGSGHHRLPEQRRHSPHPDRGSRRNGNSGYGSQGGLSTGSQGFEETYQRLHTSGAPMSVASTLSEAPSLAQRTSSGEPFFKFEVLPSWRREHKQLAATLGCPNARLAGSKRNKSLIRKATLHIPLDERGDISSESTKGPCSWCTRGCLSILRHIIIHPNQPVRGFWDMWSLGFVVYDMVAIPLELLDPPENLFTLISSWFCRVFWSLDIPFSFLTGFLLPDGIIEMRPWRIARRYFFGWFAMDLFLVLLDWMEIFWGQDNALGYARAGKTSRTLRIIRMIRLLRLARMKEVVRLITERIQSERLTIVAEITQIMVIIVGMAHLVACIWYGIGNIGDSGTWVTDLGFQRQALGYRYMTSLHWSLSQFSGGMDEIRPHNVAERLYAVCVFLLAFVMAAVFVSSLTSSMTRLHIIASHQSRQLSILRRYLSQNGISDRLAMRVQRNAQHAISEQQRLMPEHSVDLLMVVSEPLRVELHFEMHCPLLSVHPFFLRYCEECPQVMKKVCHSCMSMLLVSTGDVIFSAGEIPSQPKMYFICSGNLEYVPIVGTVEACHQGMWLSEGAIWTPWMHRGVFRAMDDCRICCLDATYFKDIASSFDHPDFDPKVYAEEFVKVLNSYDGETTDLPGVEIEAIKILNKVHFSSQGWFMSRSSPFHGSNTKRMRKRQSASQQVTRSKSLFGRLM